MLGDGVVRTKGVQTWRLRVRVYGSSPLKDRARVRVRAGVRVRISVRVRIRVRRLGARFIRHTSGVASHV